MQVQQCMHIHAGRVAKGTQCLHVRTSSILAVLRAYGCWSPIAHTVWYSQAAWAPQACAGIFLAAAFTDFLDGYLARNMVTISVSIALCM